MPDRRTPGDSAGIYDRYGQTLLAVARRMLGDAAGAEDAVQDTFIRAFRAMGTFRGESQLGHLALQDSHAGLPGSPGQAASPNRGMKWNA